MENFSTSSSFTPVLLCLIGVVCYNLYGVWVKLQSASLELFANQVQQAGPTTCIAAPILNSKSAPKSTSKSTSNSTSKKNSNPKSTAPIKNEQSTTIPRAPLSFSEKVDVLGQWAEELEAEEEVVSQKKRKFTGGLFSEREVVEKFFVIKNRND